MEVNTVYCGDALQVLKTFPAGEIDCCVTSPPYYGLRDYGVEGQLGLEETPEEYIDKMVEIFNEVKRVLKDDGTLWLNIGDSYAAQRSGTHQPAETLAGGTHGKTDDGDIVNRGRGRGYNPTRNASAIGLKHKDLIGIPWMLAFALRNDGWYLRQDIIWHKPNPMPESVKDRCTKSHEYIFLLSKKPRYYFNYKAIQEKASTQTNEKPKKFGGNKYRNSDDPHYRTKSEKTWVPKEHKNLQENGQQNHSMHERRAEGLPDKNYVVRNKRDVWSVTTKPVKEAHFATFPEELIEPCILAGSRKEGIVLDPFFGSGTTGIVATKFNRKYVGIELNPEYIEISNKRVGNIQMTLEGFI